LKLSENEVAAKSVKPSNTSLDISTEFIKHLSMAFLRRFSITVWDRLFVIFSSIKLFNESISL